MNPFPTNNLSFAAAAALTGKITVVKHGNFDFELSPGDVAFGLWGDYQADRLIYSARLLQEQIREIKNTLPVTVIGKDNPPG